MKLKVCGMKDSRNIQELTKAVNLDWMGMIFYPPSPRFVGDEPEAILTDPGLKKVGVFVNEPLASIQEKAVRFGLSVLQLHGDESVEEVRLIKEKTGLEIFKVFKVGDQLDWSELKPYLPCVDYFLFDTFTKQYGGSGKTFNWDLLKTYPFDKPFILSGGIESEYMNDIVSLKKEVPQLEGLDINSRFEVSPGLKDIERIKAFKEQLIMAIAKVQ